MEEKKLDDLKERLHQLEDDIEYHEKTCKVCQSPFDDEGEYQECLILDAMNCRFDEIMDEMRKIRKIKD